MYTYLSLVPTSENYKFSQQISQEILTRYQNLTGGDACQNSHKMKSPEILMRNVRFISNRFDIFLTDNVLRIWIANNLKGMPPDMEIII